MNNDYDENDDDYQETKATTYFFVWACIVVTIIVFSLSTYKP